MVGWHHRLEGHEQESGIGDRQETLACCGPWGHKELDTTVWLNWTKLRKGRGTRDQLVNIHWIIKKSREFQKNIYFFFIDYEKALDCVDNSKLWNILKKWEYQTTLPALWQICMPVKKQQLELDMEQQIGFKLEKE